MGRRHGAGAGFDELLRFDDRENGGETNQGILSIVYGTGHVPLWRWPGRGRSFSFGESDGGATGPRSGPVDSVRAVGGTRTRPQPVCRLAAEQRRQGRAYAIALSPSHGREIPR